MNSSRPSSKEKGRSRPQSAENIVEDKPATPLQPVEYLVQEEKVSRPKSKENRRSRPSSAENLVDDKPATPPQSVENLVQEEKLSSRPSSKEKIRSRPSENLVEDKSPSRALSIENLVQEEEKFSRPSSKEKRRSRPPSAESHVDDKPPSRTPSAENLNSYRPNSKEKQRSRPQSAEKILLNENKSPDAEQKNSRPSSGGRRPSSAEKRSSRPSSAQSQTGLSTLPEDKQIKDFEEKLVALHSESIAEQDQVESSRLQNSEAVLERPSSSSKERKKKKSKDSVGSLGRAVSPTDRKKSSNSKRSSKQEFKGIIITFLLYFVMKPNWVFSILKKMISIRFQV